MRGGAEYGCVAVAQSERGTESENVVVLLLEKTQDFKHYRGGFHLYRVVQRGEKVFFRPPTPEPPTAGGFLLAQYASGI